MWTQTEFQYLPSVDVLPPHYLMWGAPGAQPLLPVVFSEVDGRPLPEAGGLASRAGRMAASRSEMLESTLRPSAECQMGCLC